MVFLSLVRQLLLPHSLRSIIITPSLHNPIDTLFLYIPLRMIVITAQSQYFSWQQRQAQTYNIIVNSRSMSTKNFEILAKLGQGAYSKVYRVKRNADQKEYALKIVRLGNLSSKEQENALTEVRILASLRSDYIVGYKEAFLEDDGLCIVMEFADDGDLYQKICDYKKQHFHFEEKEIWRVLVQIVHGLKTLHSQNIMHRDLKSANVFLTKDGVAKLGDMNVSKIAKNGLLYTQTGTPYYASPEVWKDKPYDAKADIWSLGCVIYEMITLRPPFRAEDMEGLYKKVIKGTYNKIPSQYSMELSNVIRAMLQVNPALRPSSQRLAEMPTVLKKMEEYKIEISQDENLKNQMLKTIKMPRNLHYLTDRLPKPNYMKQMHSQYKNTTLKDEHPLVYSNSLSKGSGLNRVNPINRKVVKTKIVSMNINPVLERHADYEPPRYKRSPIKQPARNISLPPIK